MVLKSDWMYKYMPVTSCTSEQNKHRQNDLCRITLKGFIYNIIKSFL